VLRYQHVEQDQPVEIHPGVLRPVDYSQPHHIQIRAYQRPQPGHQRGHSSGPLDPVVPHSEAQTFLAVSLVRNASRPVRRNIYMETVRIRILRDAHPAPTPSRSITSSFTDDCGPGAKRTWQFDCFCLTRSAVNSQPPRKSVTSEDSYEANLRYLQKASR